VARQSTGNRSALEFAEPLVNVQLGYRVHLAFVAIMAGCPPPRPVVVICNNTGARLDVISTSGKAIPWTAETTLEIGKDRDISWDELEWAPDSDGLQSAVLTLRSNARERRFMFDSAMPTVSIDTGAEPTRIFFQMQNDGRIFAAKAKSRCPAPTLPAQPPGAPISAQPK
jgi:hypothetical protein